MRRLLAPTLAALVGAALLPLPVLAADPVPAAGAVTTDEDTPVTVTLSATDEDGDAITFDTTDPAHGTLGDPGPVTCEGTPSACTAEVQYTPVPNWSGEDALQFTATAGGATSEPATVAVTVAPVNDPPVARTDGITIAATASSAIPVLAGHPVTGAGRDHAGPFSGTLPTEADDTLAVTSVTQGVLGAVSIAPGGAAVVYDPKGCATGGDVFTYTITDGGGLTATASVFVTIARPGTSGLSSAPITDVPTLGFITGSTIGRTQPARLAWCAVTRSGTSIRTYRIGESWNAGATWPANLVMTAGRSPSSRSLAANIGYRWRIRTVDAAGRVGAWRTSVTARITRHQESSPALAFSPLGWATTRTDRASGGVMRRASSPAAWVRLTVTDARQVAIVGPVSPTRGSFHLYVDGVRVRTVSERSATLGWRRVLVVRSLAPGVGVSHTIELRPAGNGRIDLDAILVLR